MDGPDFKYILQVHRDDRFWYERPCKTDTEVDETIDRIMSEPDWDVTRMWFRIYKHYYDCVEF